MSEWTDEERQRHAAEWTRQYDKGVVDGKTHAVKYIAEALRRAYPSTIYARTEHVIKLIEDLDV